MQVSARIGREVPYEYPYQPICVRHFPRGSLFPMSTDTRDTATTDADAFGLLPAAAYVRISDDREGRELGVTRQVEDIAALAAKLGYHIVGKPFKDNDIGASRLSKKPRPGYAAMMERAWAGDFRAILAYSNSRLTRRPREFEDIIDLHRAKGVKIVTVASGQDDLSTADGVMTAGIRAQIDAGESERTGERIRRAALQRAQQGKRHGMPPYGWRIDGDGEQVVDPETGGLLRDAARRVLARESIRSIAKGLNDRGVMTPRVKFYADRGKPFDHIRDTWDAVKLRQLLLRQSNAGRRIHQKQLLGAGTWEPLWDEAQQDRLTIVLTNPKRVTSRGTAVKHLLSGIATCGRTADDGATCGGRLDTVTIKGKGRKYRCSQCTRLARMAEPVEREVVAKVVARLARPDAVELLGGDPRVSRDAADEMRVLQERLDDAALRWARGSIDGSQLDIITAELRPKVDAARSRMLAAAPTPEFAKFAAPQDMPPAERRAEVARRWDAATIEERRALLRHMVEIVVLPQGAGRNFDPDLIVVTPKDFRRE